jgi:hypothetical protein
MKKRFPSRYDGPRTKRFSSVNEFHLYAIAHPEALNSYSPGGAAARLGVGRERVYQLIGDGRFRAWFIFDQGEGEAHDVPGNRASYVYVSAEDVHAYGANPRRPGVKPKEPSKAIAC